MTVDELLCEYDQAPTWAEAQSALDRIPRAAHHPEVELGELYDEVATNLADEDDFEGAARAQRQALDEGCKYPELGREMLAWYVLKAGRREEAEGLLAELRRERPRDAELELLVGSAFSDAGDGEAALAAFDRALVLARAAGNLQTARRARAEREWTRRELGLEPDADDRLRGASSARSNAPSPATARSLSPSSRVTSTRRRSRGGRSSCPILVTRTSTSAP